VTDHQAAKLFAHKHSEFLNEPKTEKAQTAPKQATVQTVLRQLSKAAQLLPSRDTLTEEEWQTLTQLYGDVMAFNKVPVVSKK
jgi:hypothetical protein